MRRLSALMIALAASLGLQASSAAQIPALSVAPELPKRDTLGLKQRLAVLTDSATHVAVHSLIENTLDSLFAADCGEEFDTPTLVIASSKKGKCFWGKHEVSALNLGNITTGNNTGSLYTDLTTAYFGPMRLSFSTLVSASGDDEQNDDQDARAAFQRLIAGGGNLVSAIQVPIVHYRAAQVNGFRFTTAFLARGAADVSALGADSSQAQTRSLATGLDVRFQLNSNDEQVAVFLYSKGEYVRGSDLIPSFLSNTSSAGEHRHLLYGQASVGARLLNAVVVTYTFYGCEQCRRAGVSNQLSITAQKSGI